jgi:hypothetical protein
MLLTHYYHQNDRPFQNLSALTTAEALRVMNRLQSRNGAVYRRFCDPEKYCQQRRSTETWVREEFIQKGGQPIGTYPHYFVVGRSRWIEDGYNGESRMVQFPVTAFDVNQISFTYPDSMISDWLRGQTGQAFHHPEYHGQVFRLDEISAIVDRFGIPDHQWQRDESRKYDLFIEAQIWGEIPFVVM